MNDAQPIAIVLATRARIESANQREQGLWEPSDTAALDAAFTDAATAALRAPVLVERSIVLRAVGKRLLPKALRPALRRVALRVDAASRSLERRRSSRAGHR